LSLLTINIMRKPTTRFISPSGSLSFIAAFIEHHDTLIFELIVSFPLSGSYDPHVAKKVITFKANLQQSTSTSATTAKGIIKRS
jgi:hypothetical protein